MSRERVTTTRNFGQFRREDITFSEPRMQSQILDEVPREQVTSAEPEPPVSSTPEQVIRWYEECIEKTSDKQKKHVYGLTVKWIKELEEKKQAEVAEKVKSFTSKGVEDDSSLDELEVE